MSPEEKVVHYNYLIESVVPSLKRWVKQDEVNLNDVKMSDDARRVLGTRISDNKYIIKSIEGNNNE